MLDFGVSKIIDAATLTHEKAMVGTPLYMSPEQAVGTQELSPASDVFSLGSIAYEMLTGRRAFAASSIPSILYQIVHGPTPALTGRVPGIGPVVDEVFARVLAKRREERFQRAGDFAAALQRVIDRQSGQMPIVRMPTTPALDGNWPDEEKDEPLDLASAPDGPSGLFKTGVAGATDVDPSTKAEEAMDALAEALPPPSLVARHPSLARPSQERLAVAPVEAEASQVPELRPRRRWPWALALLVPALAAGLFMLQRSKNPPATALVPHPEAAPAAPRPAPPRVTIPAAPPPPPLPAGGRAAAPLDGAVHAST